MKVLLKNRRVGMSAIALVLCCTLVACTVDQVLADINMLIQISASIGSAVGPVSATDGAEIQKLSSIASTGMAAIKAAYTTYKQSGAISDMQKVQAAIGALQSNLAQELSAAHILNPASQQKVTNWVNLISSTLAAVLAALPQLQNKQLGKQAKLASSITPKTLKARWTTEVCGGDQVCAALVH